MSQQTDELRKAAACVYLVTDARVAMDLDRILRAAADKIDELDGEVKQARQTSQFHKDNHLAAEAENTLIKMIIDELRSDDERHY